MFSRSSRETPAPIVNITKAKIERKKNNLQILLLPRRRVFIKVKKSPSGKEENDNSNKHNNKNP